MIVQVQPYGAFVSPSDTEYFTCDHCKQEHGTDQFLFYLDNREIPADMADDWQYKGDDCTMLCEDCLDEYKADKEVDP